MRSFGIVVALVLGGIGVAGPSAEAGVVKAVIEKHKSNPEGLHAKIKQHKVMNPKEHKLLHKHK